MQEFIEAPESVADPGNVDRMRTELVRRLQALEQARHDLRQLIDAFGVASTVEEKSLNDELQARYERSFKSSSGC